MDKVRAKGVGLVTKGGRKVVISHGGERTYYGHFGSLAEANSRARDVWQWVKVTGRLPIILEEGDRPIGECPLAPHPGT